VDRKERPPHIGAFSDSKEDSGFNPLTAAALVGGAVAAGAGAYLGTRALARKNRAKDGRPINSVMATAITATDLAQDKEPVVAPAPRSEPKA
jgi:hypothetical protein